MSARAIRSFVPLGPGSAFVQGPASNWAVVAGPDGATLVDAGYPADGPLVLESLRRAGHDAGDVRRIVITHAHTDHIGGIGAVLEQEPQAEVLAAADEVAAVRGPERAQVTVADIGVQLLRPRVIGWALGAIRAGGLASLTVPEVRAFTDDDLAAAGLRAVPAPGHTVGSCAYALAEGSAILTGDALISGHAVTSSSDLTPRAIPEFFSTDTAGARATASTLAQRFEKILPGHGPAVRRAGATWERLAA